MKNQIKKRLLLILFLFLFGVKITDANSSPFYVGVGYGSAQYIGSTLKDIKLKPGSKLFKKADNIYQILAGYTLVDNLISIETSYINLGSVNETFDLNPELVYFDAPHNTITVEGKGITIAPVLKWQVTSKTSVSGVLGASILDVQRLFSGGFSEATERYSSFEIRMYAGFGLELKLYENLSVIGQWQKIRMSDSDIITSSFHFNLKS